MKREFLQELKVNDTPLPKELIDAIMAENGRDIEAAKKPYAGYDALKERLRIAEEGLAAFDGVDPAALNAQIEALKGQLSAQAEGFAIDSALDAAIRDAGGRNVRAVRAMLGEGIEALKASHDRAADIQAAIAALAKEDPWAFAAPAPQDAPGLHISTGIGHGAPGTGESEGVEAAFAALNPGLRMD